MSGDYGTIMESIMCEQSTPMLKNAIDVYTQYENEVLSLARKHRLRAKCGRLIQAGIDNDTCIRCFRDEMNAKMHKREMEYINKLLG